MSRTPQYNQPHTMQYPQHGQPSMAPPSAYGQHPHGHHQGGMDPSMYSFGRENGWHGNGHGGSEYDSSSAYGGGSGQAGPSREAYHGYGQPGRHAGGDPRQGPLQSPAQPPPSGAPTGQGWSSVHPSAAAAAAQQQSQLGPPRMPDSRGGAVKLDDLVGGDRGRMGVGNGKNNPGGFTTIPLNHIDVKPSASALAGLPGPPGSAGPGLGGGGGGDPGATQQPGPSEFIKKLYKMLEEESAAYGKARAAGKGGEGPKRGPVGWGRGGQSFVVWDMNDFTTKVLPQTFRHSNFSSFVRQLNKYGFSKIKHVDEDNGQIKENIWEFQHPNFQAGGKADLDSIKRKAVVPKKGAQDDAPGSPGGRGGLGQDDTMRLMEMESRVMMLEDRLAKALEDIQDSRQRELGFSVLLREMAGHLAPPDRDASSPRDASARTLHLYHMIDQVYGPATAGFGQLQPGQAGMFPPPGGLSIPFTHVSPATDPGSGSRSVGENPSPSGSGSSRQYAGSGVPSQMAQNHGGDGQEQQRRAQTAVAPNTQHTLYNGEPVGMTPTYPDQNAWLTEGDGNVPIQMYHRKSSDGQTLRIMMEALSGGNVRFEDNVQDPLDITMQGTSRSSQSSAGPANQPSPFGTLVISPAAKENAPAGPARETRLRRSTIIKPHWNKVPRILVVEDDVVYRQLSSKFLEKFGCEVETVENAQRAIEKMNQTKFDLVLMDVFFGPSMDGRKATSLIRQFDRYTPIISMTSNAQPQDVDSYLQSGMNDVLAKPFTKNGLFGILDKHLIHLKAIQLSAEVPRSVGVPPLSDQGVLDALASDAAILGAGAALRNSLSGMGWSDETYQIILSQFMQTGSMPELGMMSVGHGVGSMGTNILFPESSMFVNNGVTAGDATANSKKRSASLSLEWDNSATGEGGDERDSKRARE